MGTSLINSPMSPPFLSVLKRQEINKNRILIFNVQLKIVSESNHMCFSLYILYSHKDFTYSIIILHWTDLTTDSINELSNWEFKCIFQLKQGKFVSSEPTLAFTSVCLKDLPIFKATVHLLNNSLFPFYHWILHFMKSSHRSWQVFRLVYNHLKPIFLFHFKKISNQFTFKINNM